MTRRPSALTLLFCLAASILLHAAWFGGTWWLIPLVPVAGASTVASQDRPTPPRNQLGSGGAGDAVLSRDADREQVADEWIQDQPLLAIQSTPPRSIAVHTASDAPQLNVITPDLPGRTSAGAMASLLSPPESIEETKETPPPVAQSDDRDSSPTSKTPSIVVEAQSGRTVSQEGLDFKLIGLRAGLTAMREGAFLAPDTRYTARIEVDDTGTPLKVQMLRSTGSDAVDRVIHKLLFNSWFDHAPGEPFEFTLVLR